MASAESRPGCRGARSWRALLGPPRATLSLYSGETTEMAAAALRPPALLLPLLPSDPRPCARPSSPVSTARVGACSHTSAAPATEQASAMLVIATPACAPGESGGATEPGREFGPPPAPAVVGIALGLPVLDGEADGVLHLLLVPLALPLLLADVETVLLPLLLAVGLLVPVGLLVGAGDTVGLQLGDGCLGSGDTWNAYAVPTTDDDDEPGAPMSATSPVGTNAAAEPKFVFVCEPGALAAAICAHAPVPSALWLKMRTSPTLAVMRAMLPAAFSPTALAALSPPEEPLAGVRRAVQVHVALPPAPSCPRVKTIAAPITPLAPGAATSSTLPLALTAAVLPKLLFVSSGKPHVGSRGLPGPHA
jgi:hypothetical protein